MGSQLVHYLVFLFLEACLASRHRVLLLHRPLIVLSGFSTHIVALVFNLVLFKGFNALDQFGHSYTLSFEDLFQCMLVYPPAHEFPAGGPL